MGDVIHPGMVRGEARGHRIEPRSSTWRMNLIGGKRHPIRLPGIWTPVTSFVRNDILYDWATILCELLRNAPDKKPYHIGGMYIEFENNGGAAVTPPTVYRDLSVEYYTSLSSPRDYLRVPLVAATLTATDETKFPRGNKLSFFAQTQGVLGQNGLEFSEAAQSRIFGAALVTFPEFSDQSQDLIHSRFYFDDPDDQMLKLGSSQVGIEWPVTYN